MPLPNGEKLYGSAYSVFDAHEDLGRLSPLAKELQIGMESANKSLMGVHAPEGGGHRSVVVASGSFAQRRINPYPGDLDFAEHFVVQSESLAEAGKWLEGLLQDTVKCTSQSPNLEFLEMKCGLHPFLKEKGQPIALKWTREEISNGQKVVINPTTGERRMISLSEAAENPGMVKFDYIGRHDGEMKEVTNVLNLTVRNSSGETMFTNRLDESAFQEVYFGNPDSHGLTELLRKPEVAKSYMDFLKKDVKKYATDGNHMKSAIRLYNYLKVSGDIDGSADLAKLFNSPTSELASKVESMRLIADHLPRLKRLKPKDFVSQTEGLQDFVRKNRAIIGDVQSEAIMRQLNEISTQIQHSSPNLQGVQRTARSIVSDLTEVVNRDALRYLENNPIYQSMLQ